MTTPAPRSADPVREVWKAVRWYVREVTGGSAYDRYLARHERDHPGVPALDEATFWRQRVDGREGEPPQRCC